MDETCQYEDCGDVAKFLVNYGDDNPAKMCADHAWGEVDKEDRPAIQLLPINEDEQ